MKTHIRLLYVLPGLNGGGAERSAINLFTAFDRSKFMPKMWLYRRVGHFLSMVPANAIISDVDENPPCQKSLKSANNNRRLQNLIGSINFRSKFKRILNFKQDSIIRRVIEELIEESKLFLDKDEINPLIEKHFSITKIRHLLKTIEDFDPHIILSSIPEHSSFLVYICKRLMGQRFPKWIVREGNNTWTRSVMYFSDEHERNFWNQLISNSYQNSDRIIAISEGVKRGLTDNYKITDSKIVIVPNPIDIKYINKRKTEKLQVKGKMILACGRLNKQKGFDVLLKAFHRIVDKAEENLVIIGEGKERGNLLKLISNLNLEERVTMPGFIENPWSFMARARCFVLPSRFEGFGHVVGEAMVCECPVIVSDCDYGPKEIVTNDQNGRIVPRESVEELAKAIVDLLQDNDLRKKFIRNGLQTIKKYENESIVRLYEKNIDSVLEESPMHSI